MADATLLQWCTYPGIPDFESATYSATHGVTPGVVIATTRIPPDWAAPGGPFVISDGTRSLTLRDCKYQRRDSAAGLPGQVYKVKFLDRRWRWAFGAISGTYNRKDDKGNLVPWMARTPKQLAELCLKEMGENGYKIDLPDGVGADQLDQTNDNPAPGEMTPPTGTNPLIQWVDEIPAVALARLCDLFGRHLIYDPVRDIVVIARAGDGAELPLNEFLMPNVSYGVETYEKPAGVGIVGDKVKYQTRLKLEPVGLEWDDRIVPIDQLSYRPTRNPQPGQWTITLTSTGAAPYTLIPAVGGVAFGAYVENTMAALATRLAAAINGNPTLQSLMNAEVLVSGTVTITSRSNGAAVEIAAAFADDNATATIRCTRPPTSSAWELSVPGSWDDVQPTSRLTYIEARNRAIQSVGKWFRVMGDDVSNPPGNGAVKKIFVPYFGEVDRRLNLEVLPDKVEQVVPEKPNPNLVDPINNLPAGQPDYYHGYSRNKQASVYGSISRDCTGRWWHRDRLENTPAGSLVGVPFSVDPLNQMVIFQSPIYKRFVVSGIGNPLVRRMPNLVLETAVHVLDNKTFAPIRYRRWIEYGPPEPGSENRDRAIEVDLTKYGIKKAKPYKVIFPRRRENVGTSDVPTRGVQWFGHGDDIRMGIIGQYQYDAVTDTHTLLAGEPDQYEKYFQGVADSYLIAHLLQHQVEDAQTANYRGIHGCSLDGAIMQVTWSIGREGAMTVASRNHTHGFTVLPYPQKRMAENLDADAQRTSLNLASRPGDNPINVLQRVGMSIAQMLK